MDMFEDAPSIFINDKVWNKMSEEQLQEFKQRIFDYYRQHGFPYYNVPREHRLKKFTLLSKKSHLHLIKDGMISQSMNCLGELWAYFPHAFAVRCDNKPSPVDVFNDDEKFKKAIAKRIKYGSYINDSGMRKALKVVSGVQAVSNFRPTAAAALYDYFNAEVVWDMSCGYGGRLLGAFVSDAVKKYIGTEPCSPTMKGLLELRKDLLSINPSMVIELYQLGSEKYQPPPESIDLCFTSPPYFNTEMYSNEDTQSAIEFPDQDSWRTGFLKETMQNCFIGLKPGGHMVINIANVRSYPNLEADCVKTAEEVGYKLVDTMHYTLSMMMGTRKGDKTHKTEPVFVFVK